MSERFGCVNHGMGSSALDSHATGSKHKQKVLDRSRGLDIFFKKASTVSDGETDSSSSSKTNTAGADA